MRGRPFDALDARVQHGVRQVAARRHVARDPATFGATMFGWVAVGAALLRQKAERETAP